MKPTLKSLLVLSTLLLPVFLFGLGERPVSKIQEVRVAETAREMLASGDWLVPRYNGELRLQKPPLPYWLTAVSYRIAGLSEFSARLPAAIFGLLSVLLIWNWLYREFGLKAAANGALVLATCYLDMRYFRSGEADAVLVFFISAACMFGYDILHGRHNTQRRLLFGLMLGLGFLSKGPAALAIPSLTLLLVSAIEKRAGRLQPSVRHFFSLSSLCVFLLAAFGWYVWIVWQLPDSVQLFFTKQLDETFISGTHPKPLWWYLAHWFEFFAPWGMLLIPAGWMAIGQRKSTAAPLPSLIRFAWVWLFVVFVLLTMTINKQMQYALLFAPPLAILLGHYLTQAQGGFAKANRILFATFCLVSVAGILLALRKSSSIPTSLLWLSLPVAPLLMQRLLRETFLSTPVLLVAGMTATAFLYSEAYFSKEPDKIAAQTVMLEAAKHQPLYQIRTSLNDGALSFYAGRVVPPADATEIALLLQRKNEIWLVGEDIPAMPDVESQVTMEVHGLKLYRLRSKP